MGSERVPSLSDGEWGDTGSDSAQEYHHRLVQHYHYFAYNLLTHVFFFKSIANTVHTIIVAIMVV